MQALRFALLGLGAGAIYALAAQGIVLVYRGSGVLNFASGAMGMIGAELFYQLKDSTGVDWKLALVVGVVAPALIGAATHLLVMRWLRDATGLVRLLATLGLFTGLTQLGLQIWTGETKIAVSILPQTLVRPLHDTAISVDRFVLLGIAFGLTVALTLVYRFTTFGFATSAVAENPRAVAALGHSPDVIATVNWTIGGALAGLAAILLAPISGLSPIDLPLLVIPALAAALVGSFSSFTLTFVGAVAIGVVESEMAWLASRDDLPEFLRTPGLGRSVPFLVIILVLVLRGRALPVRGEASARPPQLGSGRVDWRIVCLSLAVGLALTWFVFDGDWLVAAMTTIFVAMIGLSLVVVTGYTGQLSLAQVTLAGIGAWMAGRLADSHGLPFELALLVGLLGAIPVGILVALPSLRTRGVNLAVSTLGMALALEYMVLRNANLTGGLTGTKVAAPRFFGIDVDAVSHPKRYATLMIGFLALELLVVANLRRGRAGRRMIAVRTNERAAASLGISVFGAKLYAFGLAAAIAGLGGVLYAFRTPLIVYDQAYGVLSSIGAVVYAVIGGIGFVVGPLMGATLAPSSLGPKIIAFADGFFDFALGLTAKDFLTVAGGFLLITMLLQNPNGFAAANELQLRRTAAWWRRRRNRPQPPVPAVPPRPVVPRGSVTPKTLDVRSLTVSFGGVVALDDASLTVGPGQVVGLIGPNGAGKTTLIDAVTGFVRPRGGHLLLDGASLARLNARRRARAGLGRSFQSLELFDDMTVRDNLRTASDRRDALAYVTDLVRPGDPPLSAAAVAAVREFGLEADLDRKPAELPYGRRRLVGIARAVAAEPSVLLLDEPAAGLDDHETRELGRLIRRLADDWGLGIVLVEHDVGLVLGVCDRIVALDFGRVIAEGTPDEIRTDPLVVAAYLGTESLPVEDRT
jgi:ABC-type branched-subunit amino acid transport system ATPase component/ABC-type branched-subunit amino acid transport system permease subunit